MWMYSGFLIATFGYRMVHFLWLSLQVTLPGNFPPSLWSCSARGRLELCGNRPGATFGRSHGQQKKSCWYQGITKKSHVSENGLPSGNLTVCYWKWPSRNSGLTHSKIVIFHSYINVYQRVYCRFSENSPSFLVKNGDFPISFLYVYQRLSIYTVSQHP